MEISVSKKEIFDEVEKRSSLEGMALPERFEGVWASEKDGEFLDSFWIEGYTAVIQLLKRYLVSDTINFTLNNQGRDETLFITADMPARYTHLLDGSVATDIKMLIACNIIHGWLEIKAPDAAHKYNEEAKGYSEDIRVKLLYRAEPTSPISAIHKEDDCSISRKSELSARHKNDGCSIYPRYEFINPAKRDCIRLPEQWSKCNNKDVEGIKKDYSCPCIKTS